MSIIGIYLFICDSNLLMIAIKFIQNEYS